MPSLQSVERSPLRFLAELCATYTPAGREAAILPPLEAELAGAQEPRDPKSLLQEWTQGRLHLTPAYQTVAEEGPDHAKRFTVEVMLGGAPYGRGQGASKQAAALPRCGTIFSTRLALLTQPSDSG